jgi:hypothetical protein
MPTSNLERWAIGKGFLGALFIDAIRSSPLNP